MTIACRVSRAKCGIQCGGREHSFASATLRKNWPIHRSFGSDDICTRVVVYNHVDVCNHVVVHNHVVVYNNVIVHNHVAS